ncbi:MAG: hypothetical protein KY476_26210 [Planctomycetes bacterium]|nr:hypothetical protein [Planctomycetota bacterium]
MTFDDLKAAIDKVLSAGRIGTPVSVRVHVQIARADAVPPYGGLAAAMRLADRVFDAEPCEVTARRADGTVHLNVLAGYPRGRTALVSIAFAADADPRLDLLVIGNHGIARLEGGELFDGLCAADDHMQSPFWQQLVEQSLREKRRVAGPAAAEASLGSSEHF